MLTVERYQMILKLLMEKRIVSIQELVQETSTSESTIRRDLTLLEEKHQLKRVHGGATLMKQNAIEPDLLEKSTAHLEAKEKIAKYAASLIDDFDCVYLDAGTSVQEMIPYLEFKRSIKVVTNGFMHIERLMNKGITTYLIGGRLKERTGAIVGKSAIASLQDYCFDKSFIGINGIHDKFGYTTPDPEEAYIKQKVIELSRVTYVIADDSKFGETSFSQVESLEKAAIITATNDTSQLQSYRQKTEVLNALG